MHYQLIPLSLLFLTFCALVFLPGAVSARLRPKALNTRGVRIFGCLGFVWIGLALLTTRALNLGPSSEAVHRALDICRHCLGGGMVGFLLGLEAGLKQASKTLITGSQARTAA